MEKIDRLGWAAGFSFSAYGVRAGVRVSDAAVVARLFELLPPGWKISRAAAVERLYSLAVGGECARPGVRRYSLLYADAERLSRTLDLREALDAFESDLKLYVAEGARRRVFVHAGVVGWRGRAIVIPGRSFSGKTTLVAELVRAGADYYSDEYAVLDEAGLVHPYARPLSVRREAEPAAREKISARSLGGREGKRPLRVGLVVFSRYEPGARWRPRALSPGRGALALLGHTVSARRRPARALAALRLAARGALALRGPRGEAEETAALILRAAERIA
jgi:hypothetical protein